jgi:hypothetical protein
MVVADVGSHLFSSSDELVLRELLQQLPLAALLPHAQTMRKHKRA